MDRMIFIDALKKYKWAAVILVVGIILLALPEKKVQANDPVITQESTNILSIEEALAEILSQVQGAGKVKVMLTEAMGQETLYQNDTSGPNDKQDTVIISDSDRNELGLVRQINPPVYMGAIILCQGADSPAVRLTLVEAVSAVTGLSTDKIMVLKMK